MDLNTLEYCANKFLEMCVNHPEICPHDYQLILREHKANKIITYYRCGLCGHETSIEELKNKYTKEGVGE